MNTESDVEFDDLARRAGLALQKQAPEDQLDRIIQRGE